MGICPTNSLFPEPNGGNRMENAWLKNLCFGVCIVCIVLGMTMSLGMLWIDGLSSAFTYKAMSSLGVVFVASAATLGVTVLAGKT